MSASCFVRIASVVLAQRQVLAADGVEDLCAPGIETQAHRVAFAHVGTRVDACHERVAIRPFRREAELFRERDLLEIAQSNAGMDKEVRAQPLDDLGLNPEAQPCRLVVARDGLQVIGTKSRD